MKAFVSGWSETSATGVVPCNFWCCRLISAQSGLCSRELLKWGGGIWSDRQFTQKQQNKMPIAANRSILHEARTHSSPTHTFSSLAQANRVATTLCWTKGAPTGMNTRCESYSCQGALHSCREQLSCAHSCLTTVDNCGSPCAPSSPYKRAFRILDFDCRRCVMIMMLTDLAFRISGPNIICDLGFPSS